MAHRFLAGDENGFLQLAADQWGVGFGCLENGAAAGFLREQDFGHVE